MTLRSVLIAKGLMAAALAFAFMAAAVAQSRIYASDALCKREQKCRECHGAGCAKVATPVPWPEDGVEDGVGPFVVGTLFKLTFPKGAKRYTVLADGDVTAEYGRERWVSVQVITAAESHVPTRDGAKGSRPEALANADIPRILYSKTLEDAEPAHVEDRRVWRSALMFKGMALKDAAQVTTSERESLAAYLTDARVAGDTTVGYVTHKKLKDSYLHVQTKGFSFDEFRRIVGSIEALRE